MYIELKELKTRDKSLVFKLTYSKGIRKYFIENFLYVKYDKKIDVVNKSILNIPAISNIVTLAWAVGSDIRVEELDETYLKALNKVKLIMNKWYPKLSFDTKIDVKKTSSNNFSNSGYGLLFTGGIDSSASFIRHKDKKPILISIKGPQTGLAKEKVWENYKRRLIDFAKYEGVEIDLVESNMRTFMDDRLLNAKFGRYLIDSWWVFRHGISLLGLCSPLTAVENIGNLLIASTHTREFKYPWGSHPLIDENISWADVHVTHDGYELSRQGKIRYLLKNFIEQTVEKIGDYPFLKICDLSEPPCGKCDKCLHAITALVLENIDPNKCGFKISSKTFDYIKQFLIKGNVRATGSMELWKDTQSHIPEVIDHNLYDSKDILEWLRDFDISSTHARAKTRRLATDQLFCICSSFPKSVQNAICTLAKFYQNLKGHMK